jgi:hypothetical protein
LLEQIIKKFPTTPITLGSIRNESKHYIVFSHVVDAMNNNNKIMVTAMD